MPDTPTLDRIAKQTIDYYQLNMKMNAAMVLVCSNPDLYFGDVKIIMCILAYYVYDSTKKNEYQSEFEEKVRKTV